MRVLINDLLNYSRLVSHSKAFVNCNLYTIVENVLTDFDLLIAEKNAVIYYKALPVIEAIPLQMNQLFYNLIGNALNFSKESEAPIINITTKK